MNLSTIKRHRQKLGFEVGRPKFTPHIRENNKLKRLEFCRQLQETCDSFDDVIFTDESSIQLGCNRQHVVSKVVRNLKGKVISRDRPNITKVKHPLKVHVWGGISRNGATKLRVFSGIMNAEFFTNDILKDTLLPSINYLYPPPLSHRLWQDNDPKHTSKKAKKFMEENNINWFKTPAESPDLNVIENVWSKLKYEVSKQNPKNQKELMDSIIEVWETHLTREQCNRYIDHIYKVIPKVIEAEGGFSGC